MGCDGGTIPTRDELVRLKKKPEQKDKDSERAFLWKHCAITQEPLRSPIVACELGSLYNKESVLELILDPSKFPGSARFDHIRGLKDIKSLELTTNPAYRDPKGDKGGVYIDRNTAQYICPITGLEMSGKYRFCYLKNCGCVFAERATKEIKTETCTKCNKPYHPRDVILLNGSEEEVEVLRERMEERRRLAKLEKKSKKKHKLEASAAAPTADGNSTTTEDGPASSKQPKLDVPSVAAESSSKLINGFKKPGAIPPAKGATATSAASSKLASQTVETKKYSSIQKNPNASAVYKSLFTSSEQAKRQPKGHWVTYNPQYN